MGEFTFKVGPQFTIENLGESMNSQFLKFYEGHFMGSAFDVDEFKTHAFDFFDQNDDRYHDHHVQNGFFNNFTILWNHLRQQGRVREAEGVWSLPLSIAYEWETKNRAKTIHKGTPYYFWGGTCIENGDLEKGFLLMHQSLKEDKDTFKTPTPAYRFVTLDYGEEHYFDGEVDRIAIFVAEKLKEYCCSGRGMLTMEDFRSAFLKRPILQDEVFYFVFSAFRVKRMTDDIDQRLQENVFSSLLQANTLLDVCLIVENTIKKQGKYTWNFSKKPTACELLTCLSIELSLCLHLGTKGSRDNNLGRLNKDFEADFPGTVQALQTSTYKFQDGTPPQPIEEDLAITYGVRNFVAHKIEDQPIIYKNFKAISQRILNALFFSIEKLYL